MGVNAAEYEYARGRVYVSTTLWSMASSTLTRTSTARVVLTVVEQGGV